jgi:hypothetical protein
MKHHAFDEEMDIHNVLLPYAEALSFFEDIESSSDVKRYCNGSNRSGRWIFQIYNVEFIEELSSVINNSLQLSKDTGPVLEVMCGDGRLTEFLQVRVRRNMIATDAKDGRYNIAYPKWVETLDAEESVAKYSPAFIIISWEPYLSMKGIDIVRTGIPTAWIGNPEMCGHPDLYEFKHVSLKSPYALSRHDSFLHREFRSDVFLFNCDDACISASK